MPKGTSGLAMAMLLAAGCASEPPPPRGPTMEQFQEVSDRLDAALQETEALREQVARATAEARAAREAAAVASLEVARLTVEKSPPAVASHPIDAAPQPPAKGMVLAADPKMDLYLISIGRTEGIKVGDELTVFRKDAFVAVVVVDRIFADKASVRVKRENDKPLQKSEIRTGDKVTNGL